MLRADPPVLPPFDAVLFDLDGVLIDSRPPIRHSFGHALAAMGRPALGEADVNRFIGPPLEVSAAMALGTHDPATVRTFVGHFREAYRACYLALTEPANGLVDVLAEVSATRAIVLATSKPEAFAGPLLDHFGVRGRFVAVCGRSLALDAETKAAVVGRALGHTPHVPREQVLMVGDREHDVVGAREHGVRTVGMLHGAGTREELEAAGADWILPDLPALARALRPAASA